MGKIINQMSPQSGRMLLSGAKVGDDLAFIFANSVAINTQVSSTISTPIDPVQAYKISVYNPSVVSALTVKLFTVEKGLGGADCSCLLETLTVPKAQVITGTLVDSYEFLLGGIFCGGDLKIVVSNDTVLSAAEGFAVTVRIREV